MSPFGVNEPETPWWCENLHRPRPAFRPAAARDGPGANRAGLQGKKHIRSGDRDNDSSLSNSRGSHVFPVHSMFLL